MRLKRVINSGYRGPHGGLDCGCHIELHDTDFQLDKIRLCPRHAAVDRLIEALEGVCQRSICYAQLCSAKDSHLEAIAIGIHLLRELKEPTK